MIYVPMRDSEIIKALEWCSDLRLCVDCPMRAEGYFSHSGNACRQALMKNALNLIIRQTADIEALQGALKAEERHNELTMEMAQKALANAKAEVVREIFEEINTIKKEYASGDIDGNELYVRLYMLEKKYTENKE